MSELPISKDWKDYTELLRVGVSVGADGKPITAFACRIEDRDPAGVAAAVLLDAAEFYAREIARAMKRDPKDVREEIERRASRMRPLAKNAVSVGVTETTKR